MRTVGQYLSEYRQHHGYTRDQLAALLSISSGQVFNLEKGLSFPSVPTLREIAQLLGLDARTVGVLVLTAEEVAPMRTRGKRFTSGGNGRIVEVGAAA